MPIFGQPRGSSSGGGGSSYTDENAQDAVGTVLTDSATVDFTYDDAGGTITAVVKDGSLSTAKLSFDVATQAELDAHDVDTTSVHGIADTSALATKTYADGAVSTHAGAADPHGDRAYAVTLVDDLSGVSNASTARSNLGLGTAATHAHGDYEVAGAAAAAQAASQPLDSDLTAIGGLTPSNDDIIQRKAGVWVNRTLAQYLGDLGLGSVYQPLDSDLTAFAALTPSNDDVAQRKAGVWTSRTMAQLAADLTALVPKSTVTAAGDVIVATGSGAITNLAIGTAAGKALVADPNATNKISVQYPHSVGEAKRGTSSAVLASTFHRDPSTEINFAALSTGRLTVVGIDLPKGFPITKIGFYSATTALSVGANQWFGVADSAFLRLCLTADDTSTAWPANTRKLLTVTGGPFVTTYAGVHYLFCMVKATTVPTLGAAGSGASIFRTGAGGNYICATADTALTNPASCPSTLGSINSLASCLYAEIE